jgi:hypothetical protein
MDDMTAFGLLGRDPLPLIINGVREEAVMVRGYEPGSGMFTLGLRTPTGERDRQIRVHRSRVELASPEPEK